MLRHAGGSRRGGEVCAQLRVRGEEVIQPEDPERSTVGLGKVIVCIILQSPGDAPETIGRVSIHLEFEIAEGARIGRNRRMVAAAQRSMHQFAALQMIIGSARSTKIRVPQRGPVQVWCAEIIAEFGDGILNAGVLIDSDPVDID